MQYQFSLVPTTYSAVEAVLSPARLGRYLKAANADKHLAARLYFWNSHICQALYLPLQTAEVAARNAIVLPVRKRFGSDWFDNPKFHNLLAQHTKAELLDTVRRQKSKRSHVTTEDHIIASLTFGFWQHLMTSSYDKHLWANGIRYSFPNAPAAADRAHVFGLLDDVRLLRNDVMHHYAIFDHKPQARYQSVLTLTNYVCAETHWLMSELSQVSQVINDRPTV